MGILNTNAYNTIINDQNAGIINLATYAISHPEGNEGIIGHVEFEVITPYANQSELFINFMRINEYDADGGLEVTLGENNEMIVSDGILFNFNPLPARYALYQNYPNPFNPRTQIRFDLPNESHVQLKIFDIQGRLIETLLNNKVNAGYHQINWNGSQFSSGMYFIQMISDEGDFIKTSKMILLK